MKDTEYELNIFTENGHIDFLMSCAYDDDVWVTKLGINLPKKKEINL